MKLPGQTDAHLTYCSNIHPGETLEQIQQVLNTHVAKVKAALCPDQPFGIGLRLSARAATALDRPESLARFKDLLAQAGLYVFTLNGFPYGDFSGARIKQRVYLPDWTDEKRLVYTERLARLLAELLPEGQDLSGSISTVPGAFGANAKGDADLEQIVDRLLRCAHTLFDIRERTGNKISLDLEPEPLCLLDDTQSTVRFFEQHLFSNRAITRFAALTGLSAGDSEAFVRRHLGVCYDACHFAVMFEDPAHSLDRFRKAGIRIGKAQISAGLAVSEADALQKLAGFDEPVYLHQVAEKRGDRILRYPDIPDALAAAAQSDCSSTWRVHFHVPIFRRQLGAFCNTSDFLETWLPMMVRKQATRFYEVETYSWEVLPERFREESLEDSIVRELRWALERMKP